VHNSARDEEGSSVDLTSGRRSVMVSRCLARTLRCAGNDAFTKLDMSVHKRGLMAAKMQKFLRPGYCVHCD